MKGKLEQKKKSGKYFLSAVIFLTVLSLARPAFSQVSILGSWVQGTTHAKESGNDRALIFTAYAELNNYDMNLASVTYGGQPMSKVLEINYRGTSTTRNYTVAYILKETGIAAATNDNFTVSWRSPGAPTSTGYASAFLQNANQIDTVGKTASAGITDITVATSAIDANNGDLAILAAVCSNTGSYTLNNGFTEGADFSIPSIAQCAAGHKVSAGPSETPSATFTGTSGRQAIIGFVVQQIPDPNKAYNPSPANGAKGVDVKTNLSWEGCVGATSYDVYFGTDPNAHNNQKTAVSTKSFDPPGDLEYGTKYYWAVDANQNGTIYPGSDWGFTTLILSDRVTGNMMLINDNGGWCWYQDEKIAYDPVGGNVLISTAAESYGFGGVGGTRLNDMDTTTFNINTGKRTRVIAKDGFGGDDHNMGAFWIRPDGRYLHVYCSHYNNWISYYRLGTNPNDGSAWDAEQTYDWLAISGLIDSPFDTNSSSYTNVQYLSGEGTGMGRLYNIIRIFTRTPCISYSDDWGQTWQFMGRLNSPAGGATYSNFYHKFQGNGVDRIYFIGNENHPRNNNNGCYAGYIQNGKSYNSYGVEIDSNLYNMTAPSIQAFTPIFIPAADQNDPNSYHTGWVNELELDRDGHPVCLYQTRHGNVRWGDGSGQNNIGAADHRFFYARFNGTSWTSTELAMMGTGLHLPEQDYIGMGCINPDDVNEIYISTSFDPRNDANLGRYRELFRGNTTDNGLTWNWTQITFDSTQDNVRPAIPKWDVNNTAVVWTRGVWPVQTTYEDYDLVAVGMVERENKSLGLVTYIDANQGNTTDANGSAFSPTGPSGSAGAVDNKWHEYTAYGNAGSCYTAGDSGTENAPAIKTTITGLANGTYDVFAYFWCDPTADWGIRGGFSSSDPNDMLCFNKQSSQSALASDFSNSVVTVQGTVLLYRVYIGRKAISDGNSVVVHIDNYDSSFSTNIPTRTTYDGIGVAQVLNSCPMTGDLNCDGRIDFQDVAVLGRGWQATYDINALADIVENWLEGTN